MLRSSRSRNAIRALLAVCATLGLVRETQAFTIITFDFHPVWLISSGEPAPAPADAPSETSNGPRYSVSDNGCFVVFTSRATNLVPGQIDGNGANDVFLLDRCASSVILVSHVPGNPDRAAAGESDQPVISPDGAYVVFRSTAADIVVGPGFVGQTNVFLWDRVADSFALVSHATTGSTVAGDGPSQNAVISRGTGNPFVAFESVARNLVTGDTNGFSDVFRYDSSTGQVILVSIPNLVPLADGGSFNPAIDGPGFCVVYESVARNLVSDQPGDDTNGVRDVFRWGAPRSTILLSHRAGAPSSGSGAQTGDGESTEPSIADNCERFAFKSLARNLAPGQAEGNLGSDVFHTGNNADAVLVSHRDGALNVTGNDDSAQPILSRDGNWVAFSSRAQDLAPGQLDSGSTSDVFVHDVSGNKTTLVSHTATDPNTVGSGESSAPEISSNGLYVAYESGAKDLDPNQNDGNGDLDVFLYNRRWNNSVLASRRYASIAITGRLRSYRPALSGNGLFVAFTSEANDLVADDPDPTGQPDVFLFLGPLNIPFLTARSTASSNQVEWVTPAVDYITMRLFRTTPACPADLSAALSGVELFPPIPPANSRGQFADGGLVPGTPYCYSMFVQNDAQASIPGTEVPVRTIPGMTFNDPTGSIKWALNLAGVTALTQVGIGPQNLVGVNNEGGVFSFTRGPAGGFWATTSWPFRVFQPIQGRPAVVPFAALGATRTTFVGSQNGRAYAFDADLVALRGGALWYSTPRLGDVVQPGAAGMFTSFGGVGDHLVIGARTGGVAQFFGLDPNTGVPRVGSQFTGGGPSIGGINTAAAVDYTLSQVYFASLEFTAGQPSVWCLRLTASGFDGTCWPPISTLGSISGGPVQRNGRLYVGTDLGFVRAFDAATGASVWGPFTNCGGTNIKSYVLADRQGTAQDLFYASSAGLCAITDLGAAPASKWVISTATIPDPSAPILARLGGVPYLYVGSSNGRLYQINADDPFAAGGIKSVLLRPGATIGPAAFDVFDSMLYLGSDAGPFFAVQAPIP